MKLYKSKKWMTLKYVHERLTEEEIAEICEVGQPTINRWLKKHGIHKKQR